MNASIAARLGLILALVFLAASVAPAQVRTWNDKSGQFSTKGQLVMIVGDEITIDTADGRRIKVSLSQLSDVDQKYIAEKIAEHKAAAAARAAPRDPAAGRFVEPHTLTAKLGVEVIAQNGPCNTVTCGFPLPLDWPEQKVTIENRETTPNVRSVTVRTLGDGVQQVRFSVPRLRAGETARVVYTLKIERKRVLTPIDPSAYRIPRAPDAKLRKYLGDSPGIETRHRIVRDELARITFEPDQSAWDQVKTIWEHTRARVKYSGVRALKGAKKALIDGTGDCEERSSVFVALCRQKGIPARCIWIPGHAYSEFYLEDAEGTGHWFPCESIADQFGEIGNRFLILQKGDNFRDPLRPGDQRYISESAKGAVGRGATAPVLKPVREIKSDGT